jgi:hypothetical protein
MISRLQNAPSDTTSAEEVRLIPRWSIVAAAGLFVFMQYLFWIILPAHRLKPSTAPLGLRVYFALSWSTLAALYMLMTGYISRDAPRRNMSTRLWVIVCLALPGGIGAVLYFLLRMPIVASCPSCGTSIHAEFHFCPQCAYQVSAACGNCYRGVRITDLYCVHCGHSLASDDVPDRLRVFQS